MWIHHFSLKRSKTFIYIYKRETLQNNYSHLALINPFVTKSKKIHYFPENIEKVRLITYGYRKKKEKKKKTIHQHGYMRTNIVRAELILQAPQWIRKRLIAIAIARFSSYKRVIERYPRGSVGFVEHLFQQVLAGMKNRTCVVTFSCMYQVN